MLDTILTTLLGIALLALWLNIMVEELEAFNIALLSFLVALALLILRAFLIPGSQHWYKQRQPRETPILRLPAELVADIFQHLPALRDRRNIRLTCKRFNFINSERLMKDLYLSKRQEEFAISDAVLKCPAIAKGIKTVIFDDSSFLVPFQSPAQWLATQDAQGGRYRPIRPWQPNYIQELYGHFAYEEQFLRATGRARANVAAAVELLPKLSNIIITDCCGPQRDPGSITSLADKKGVLFRPPLYRTHNIDWANYLLFPQPWLPRNFIADPWDEATTPYYGFVTLVRELSIAKRPIKSLKTIGRYAGMSHSLFNTFHREHSHIRNVFANITELHLTIDTNRDEDEWFHVTLQSGHLARTLASATNLTSLGLNLSGISYDAFNYTGQPEFPIGLGLPSTPWRDLEYFSLTSAALGNHRELVTFLKKHDDTVRNLSLEYVSLLNTTWHNALYDFRSRKVRLDTLKGKGVYDTQNDVLHMGDAELKFIRGKGPNRLPVKN